MQLTKNIHLSELNCKDRNSTPVPQAYLGNAKKVASACQQVLDSLGGDKIIITSAYRTPEHNKQIGGAEKSQHLYANAIDAKYYRKGVQIPPHEVAAKAREFGHYTIPYQTFTHIDARHWVEMTNQESNTEQEITVPPSLLAQLRDILQQILNLLK